MHGLATYKKLNDQAVAAAAAKQTPAQPAQPVEQKK